MDLEWCFSRDGIEWQRPQRRGWLARGNPPEPGRGWLARGNPPEPDCYGIYANHRLVQHGGKWHLFYTGVNAAHNRKHSYGPPRQLVMYATTDSPWAV